MFVYEWKFLPLAISVRNTILYKICKLCESITFRPQKFTNFIMFFIKIFFLPRSTFIHELCAERIIENTKQSPEIHSYYLLFLAQE